MRCHSARRARRGSGVTLLEMVIVLSITAIIAGAVAVFITRPVESYADATRRAELTDIADTALRRMTRDLRTALPNSIRVVENPPASGIWYLEFLQTSGGGRYRAQLDSGGGGDILDFSNPAGDDRFDVIGQMPTAVLNDWIVIYNLSNSGTVANAYDPASANRAAYDSNAGGVLRLTAAFQFAIPSPGNRFQVVQHAVTYECNPNGGAQWLRRYWDYGISVGQVAVAPPVTPNVALLATDVLGCTFTYNPSGPGGRYGIVRLDLRVQRDGEIIQIFQQVHVSNLP